MLNGSVGSALTLPGLIGASVADSRCILNIEQLQRLGSLVLQFRPHDSQAVCFLGGVFSSLATDTRPGAAQNVVALRSDLGDDPFLVIAGQQGAVVVLAVEQAGTATPRAYHVRLWSDPDLVDRAALVLAQFGDYTYSLDAVCEPEAQRAFLSTLISGLLSDPLLRSADLSALLADDQRWLGLARSLADAADSATLLDLPAVRQMLQECGAGRALLGQLDADQQQLLIIASNGAPTPRTLPIRHEMLLSVIRARRPGSASAADAAVLEDHLGPWIRGLALSALPLLRDGRVWGMLLVASERSLSASARASLNGLGVLLATHLSAAPMPVPTPQLPAAAPSSTRPAAAPRPAASAGAARGPLAARIPPRRASLVNDLLALLDHLGDAVLLVDAQGRLVAATPLALNYTGLTRESLGKSLVESGAWFLAPLLTEAVLGELGAPREIELPNGQLATVVIVAIEQSMWAFVLKQDSLAAPDALAPTLVPPVILDAERNESFLTNFSNIIRVPLRELRDLITRVPAAGELNEQQSRLIGQVVKLNSELTMLVNDLLALGQIRLQTSERKVPLRIDLLVEAAVGTQYAEFGRRGQHVTTDIPANLPRVPGSEEGLGRAVASLLDNAIKYSPTGAQIKVAVRHTNKEITVMVQDTGVGLEADEQAQIFDPFYRARSAEQLGVSGRGLGLTIAKAVIEQHGGQIWVTSVPGKGSTFAFRLPCET